MRRLLIVALVGVFVLLRFDFWWADPGTLVLGLPQSLLYHALYCFGAALLIYLLGRFAWEEPR